MPVLALAWLVVRVSVVAPLRDVLRSKLYGLRFAAPFLQVTLRQYSSHHG